MTYFDLAFATEAEAREAIATLQDLGVTGEWHLAPQPAGSGWRLSLSSERTLTPNELARLGGTLLGDADAASSPPNQEAAASPSDPADGPRPQR